MKLSSFFKENKSIAIAFSGGVDSSYLLYMAKKYATNVTAYYVKTQFQPHFELEDADKLAQMLGVQMKIIELDALCDSDVKKKPANRCYYCKKRLFSTMCDIARKDGYTMLIDGTNASDEEGDRPGMKALRELSVRSPLKECGLTKDEIRKLSKEAGLFTWDKPAYACLATRIPTGVELTEEKLMRTEKAEDFLFTLGFTDFRVREFENAAKIQIKEEQLPLLLNYKNEIITELKKHYGSVLLDMEGR